MQIAKCIVPISCQHIRSNKYTRNVLSIAILQCCRLPAPHQGFPLCTTDLLPGNRQLPPCVPLQSSIYRHRVKNTRRRGTGSTPMVTTIDANGDAYLCSVTIVVWWIATEGGHCLCAPSLPQLDVRWRTMSFGWLKGLRWPVVNEPRTVFSRATGSVYAAWTQMQPRVHYLFCVTATAKTLRKNIDGTAHACMHIIVSSSHLVLSQACTSQRCWILIDQRCSNTFSALS